MCCTTSRPLLMRGLLHSFLRIREPEGLKDSIIMVVLLLIISALAAVMRNVYFWSVINAGMRLRLSVSGLLFNKVVQFPFKIFLLKWFKSHSLCLDTYRILPPMLECCARQVLIDFSPSNELPFYCYVTSPIKTPYQLHLYPNTGLGKNT